MNTNWSILSLECKTSENGLSNVVYKVYWKCTLTEIIGEKTYSSEISSCSIIPSPDVNNFTQYELLTKEQVITWVLDTIGNQNLQEFYKLLQNDLNEQISPTVINLTPPWNN